MNPLRPKYITFDCHGTLIHFQMNEAAQALYGTQLNPEQMARFCKRFSAYRFDEAMGDWKPFAQIVHNALERTAKAFGLPFRAEDALAIYESIPSWGPHPDVPAGLATRRFRTTSRSSARRSMRC
jgi:2-haloacid dehalogenase